MKRIFVLPGVLVCFLIITLLFIYLPERTDVLVIGAGAAGMTAAIEAYDNGSDVIILEKMPFAGGNTRRAYSGMNGSETEFQRKEGISGRTDVYYNDTLKSGHYLNNKNLVSILVENSNKALMWLTGFGADLSDVGLLAGHTISRTHGPAGGAPVGVHIINILENEIQRRDIDLRLENSAVSIIYEKKIPGVLVRNETGREYIIKSKSVIFATGGFGGSPEKFVRYNPELTGFATTNHPGATGDAIPMMEEIGADLIDMSYIQAHPTVEPDYEILITEAVRGNGGILINRNGKRFTDELSFRDVLSRSILNQDGKYAYLIFDEKVRRELSVIDDYIAMDLIQSADTLENMSQLLKINSINLTDTFNIYNDAVEKGEDNLFGRHNLPYAIDTPPFYSVKVSPAVHYCMGGVRIDGKGRVLDKSGEAIPGLYAAGEVTGGVHGANRLGGNSLTETIVFGRIAGKSASDWSLGKGY